MNRRELLKLFTVSPLIWPTVVGPFEGVRSPYVVVVNDTEEEGVWLRVDSWKPSIKGRYRAILEFSCHPGAATLHFIEVSEVQELEEKTNDRDPR